MEITEVKALIQPHIQDAEILLEGEGCNFSIVVISDQFEGLSLVKKQQKVLATLSDKIATGELHAITVKAYTPNEWQQKQATAS